MRKEIPFPVKEELCIFLKDAWEKGWFDDYSDEHFVIKAIENRLTSFIGKEQLVENDLNMQGLIDEDGNVDTEAFNLNFCINFSRRMQFLVKVFGEDDIKKFIIDQMSAGKQNYREDAFFEALSEVSILSFYASINAWEYAIYEPPVAEGRNNKNPEAKFTGIINCRTNGECQDDDKMVTINIEVKSPEFPHDKHTEERIAIPTMLLTNEGRNEVRKFCEANDVTYLDPRVLKLKDFLNSAAGKFEIPKENEFNLLYINWSYRDFPSNSFLEAWALLTNAINGVLLYPEYGMNIGVVEEAYKKITAVVVYTESLEGLMFSDFRYVWQRCGAGPRFRMWLLDESLRKREWENKSNILLNITGMNPSEELTQMAMLDYKSKTEKEKKEASRFGTELVKLIDENAYK